MHELQNFNLNIVNDFFFLYFDRSLCVTWGLVASANYLHDTMDPEQKLTETRDEPQSNIEDDIKDTSILSDQNDEQNTKEDDNIGNGDAINGNTVDEEARSNEQMGYSQEELPQVIPTESNAKIPTDETQDHGPPDGIGGGGSTSEDQIKTGMKKGKRSKKHEDGLHRVTLTVTIAKAIPSCKFRDCCFSV